MSGLSGNALTQINNKKDNLCSFKMPMKTLTMGNIFLLDMERYGIH